MNHQWPPHVSRALHQFADAAPDAPSLASILVHDEPDDDVSGLPSSPEHPNRRRMMIACAAIVVGIGITGIALAVRSSDQGGDPAPAVTVPPATTVPPVATTVGDAAPTTVVGPTPTDTSSSDTVDDAPVGEGARVRVAFTARGVVHLARDGEAPRPITLAGADQLSGTCPAFSPDGGRLMFTRDATVDGAELVVVGVDDDGVATPMTTIPLPNPDVCATWAPDGRWAAYAVDDSVWVVDTIAGEVRELPDHPGVTDLEWRPDSDELAFTGGCCNVDGVGFVMGGFNTPISIYSVGDDATRTIAGVEANKLTWSPDGSRLAYTQWNGTSGISGSSGIWTVNADGTNPFPLTARSDTSNDGGGIVWSPRGDHIAYVRVPENGELAGSEVVLVETAGGDGAPYATEVVLPTTGTHVFDRPPDDLSWSPDGTQLLFCTASRADEPGGLAALTIGEDQHVVVLTDAGTADPDCASGTISQHQRWGRASQRSTPSAASEWTGPVRDADATVHAATVLWSDLQGEWVRRWDDPADASIPWMDVERVTLNDDFWRIELAARPPLPTDREPGLIISYGLVLDTTGDGVADYLIGIDNDTSEPDEFHVWLTDLATGETDEQIGPPYGFPVEFKHPDEHQPGDPDESVMWFTFLGQQPEGFRSETVRYYAWTSATRDGEVIAWDYAPDTGWTN